MEKGGGGVLARSIAAVPAGTKGAGGERPAAVIRGAGRRTAVDGTPRLRLRLAAATWLEAAAPG